MERWGRNTRRAAIMARDKGQMAARTAGDPDESFSQAERQAVYRAIFERRDVRRNFLPTPIPDEVLARLLNAAHHAGSVGFMQPWDFVIIRTRETKRAVKELFDTTNEAAALRYKKPRAELYRSLKLEGIEESSINLCVTCSRQRGGPQVLGRSTVRDTDLYSTCCAIQNLWLSARAEDIGVGWVSILNHAALKRVLGIPRSVKVLAYLCLGYVSEFSAKPDLETAGWRARLPVQELVHFEAWGNRVRGKGKNDDANHQSLYENRRRRPNEASGRATGLERLPAGRSIRDGR